MTDTFTPLRAIALSLALALPLPAMAQQAVDTAPIATAIDTFETAFTGGDMEGVFAVMPPAILGFIARQAGVSDAELRAQMASATEAAMASVEIEEFGMDLDAATTGRSPEGRAYALVPTTATMSVPQQGRFRSVNTTLALEDDGEWYLMRIDDPNQIAILRQVYPDMAGVDFPQGTLEQLK